MMRNVSVEVMENDHQFNRQYANFEVYKIKNGGSRLIFFRHSIRLSSFEWIQRSTDPSHQQ